MAVTLTQNGATFPDASQILGAGAIVACRWSYNHTRNLGDSGSGGGHLGPELTMPPTKSNGSVYLVMAMGQWDDTNQNTAGSGLAPWVEHVGNNSWWIQKQGHHAKYYNTSRDKYMQNWIYVIDDGVSSGAIVAGGTRKYRLYGQSHNGNLNWGAGSGSDNGAKQKLIVMEFDESITS